LDRTGIALIMRAMDEGSGETARLNEPHAGDPGAALSNGSALTSLLLGILAFVIQLLAWGVWFIRSNQADAAMKRLLTEGSGHSVQSPGLAGVVSSSYVSLAAGISAVVFGVKGRRLAKAEAPGRITATTGLVLGILAVSIPILALLAFYRLD
jgi:hypothetical protein